MAITCGSIGLSNLIYKYTTHSENIIIVKDKYHLGISPKLFPYSSIYNITTVNGVTYNVPFSVPFMQFNQDIQWEKLEKDKSYQIKSWGLNYPQIGMFPKIYDIKEL